MGRLVNTVRRGALATGGDPDTPLSRIAKYVPAELLAFYTLWTQAAASLPWKEHILTVCVGGAVIGVVVTFVYFDRLFPGADPVSRRFHRIISPVAFAVYSYTIMGSVVAHIFVPGVALLATAVITLVSAVAVPKAD